MQPRCPNTAPARVIAQHGNASARHVCAPVGGFAARKASRQYRAERSQPIYAGWLLTEKPQLLNGNGSEDRTSAHGVHTTSNGTLSRDGIDKPLSEHHSRLNGNRNHRSHREERRNSSGQDANRSADGLRGRAANERANASGVIINDGQLVLDLGNDISRDHKARNSLEINQNARQASGDKLSVLLDSRGGQSSTARQTSESNGSSDTSSTTEKCTTGSHMLKSPITEREPQA